MDKNLTKISLHPVTIFIVISILLLLLLSYFKLKETQSPQSLPEPSQPQTDEIVPTIQASIAVKKPADILNLTNWKLTIPTGPTKDAHEVKQPALAQFTINPWYLASMGGDSVVLRAPVNGSTTENSEYPRSELREMTNNGNTEAEWSTSVGKHTMIIDQAILAVPKTKRQIVAGQIHDGNDDVIVIRLDYPKLYVNVDGKNKRILDDSYQLGRRFTVKFEVENGNTSIYYNNSPEPVYTLTKQYSQAYFKAGAYTQSNCSREKEGLCNEDNFGEVAIYNVTVSHN